MQSFSKHQLVIQFLIEIIKIIGLFSSIIIQLVIFVSIYSKQMHEMGKMFQGKYNMHFIVEFDINFNVHLT